MKKQELSVKEYIDVLLDEDLQNVESSDEFIHALIMEIIKDTKEVK